MGPRAVRMRLQKPEALFQKRRGEQIIGIKLGYIFRTSLVEAVIPAGSKTHVATMNNTYSGILLRQLIQHTDSPWIGRPIIDDQPLKVAEGLTKNALGRLTDELHHVEKRRHDRHRRIARTGIPVQASKCLINTCWLHSRLLVSLACRPLSKCRRRPIRVQARPSSSPTFAPPSPVLVRG